MIDQGDIGSIINSVLYSTATKWYLSADITIYTDEKMGAPFIPWSFGHHHPPVVSQHGRYRSKHKDQPPCQIRLIRWWWCMIRPWMAIKSGRYNHRNGGADKNPETLHGEDCCYEGPTRPLVGVFRHDGGGERIIATDPHPEPKPKEA